MGLLARTWSVITTVFTPIPAPTVTLPPSLTFTGQTILITGASSGLGLEAAVIYASLGAKNVIITARTPAKGEAAKQTIEERTGKHGVVQVRVLDMDSFASVQNFVSNLKKEVKEIDIVLLNAGIHNFAFEKLAEGWEADLQVNVLSTALLGLLLLPWMKGVQRAGQVQHLLFVGSGAHMDTDVQAEDWPKTGVLEFWNQKENYKSGLKQYGVSKLFLQYSMKEIAKLSSSLASDSSPNPIVNSVCPGLIKTDITRHFHNGNPIYKMVVWIFNSLKASPVDVGGRTLVLATTTVESEHGLFRRPYMSDEEYDKAAEKSITSLEGQKMQAIVWKEIVGVLKAGEPKVGEIARL